MIYIIQYHTLFIACLLLINMITDIILHALPTTYANVDNILLNDLKCSKY